ncbi:MULTISPECIES: enoyl-CoA hydratase/isomerase family protein [Virgibacillus]|uniref:3-hydroxybutyryl-CoA dehydratase n=1 Tax=Virgibacillus kapii TaxID=1638645 RepID=A0ABQ2DVX2_9BACI|nr:MULTISPECIES: enoyl-CoA hydratase-related protein [Virgibacillus]EQB38005.1 hypothetical protein M948_05395 [Virgibacillus sp. CM-4]MYL40723.1 enoyl-CoA hydratase/isomerase family protein [Virgibacillus massiliensis]GGJ72624.1 3-hydroxybutyryl-CoA dehydratase [Virgibacillus kapii]
MMSFKNIQITVDHGVYWLMLHRPDSRNALNTEMLSEIEAAINEAESIPEVRVIIIHSVSEKAFAAGADIKQLSKKTSLDALSPGMQALYDKIESSKKATIAAVDGYALGGGCELAMACDIRIATEQATFGLPELNLGIIPGAGGTQRLARIIGKGRALDMILTGKKISGIEAMDIGLVTYLVATNKDLLEKANTVASRLLNRGPIAIQLAKMAVHKGYDVDQSTALWMEKLSQAVAFETEDKQEGTSAFMEKRTPTFQNN